MASRLVLAAGLLRLALATYGSAGSDLLAARAHLDAQVGVEAPDKRMTKFKADQKMKEIADRDAKLRLRIQKEKAKERRQQAEAKAARLKARDDADTAARMENQARRKEQTKVEIEERLRKEKAERMERQAKAKADEAKRLELQRIEQVKAPLRAKWQAKVAEKKRLDAMPEELRVQLAERQKQHEVDVKMHLEKKEEKDALKKARDEHYRVLQVKKRRMAEEQQKKNIEKIKRDVQWQRSQVAKDRKAREIQKKKDEAARAQAELEDESIVFLNVKHGEDKLRLKVQKTARLKVLFDVICHRFNLDRSKAKFSNNGFSLREQDTAESSNFMDDETIDVEV